MKLIVSHYGMLDGGDANGFTRNINLFSELVNFDYDITFITTQKKGFKLPYHKEFRSGVKIIAFPEIFPSRFRKGGIAPISTILKLLYVSFTKADVVYSDTGHRPNSGLPCKINRLFYNSVYISDWWEHYSIGGIYDDLPLLNQYSIGIRMPYYAVQLCARRTIFSSSLRRLWVAMAMLPTRTRPPAAARRGGARPSLRRATPRRSSSPPLPTPGARSATVVA